MTNTFSRAANGPLASALRTERDLLETIVRDGQLQSTVPGVHGPVLRLGAELELFGHDGTGRPSANMHLAVQELRAQGEHCFSYEFPACAAEIATHPVVWSPQALERLRLALNRLLTKLRTACTAQGVTPVMLGVLPTVEPGDLASGDEIVTPVPPRYKELLNRLSVRHGGYQLVIPSAAGFEPLQFDVTSSPVPAGFTAQFSPNIQVRPDQLGRMANFLIAISGAVAYLTSTSPWAFGKRGPWACRPQLWQQGMSPDRRLSPFGIGHYFSHGADALLEWFDHVLDGEEIIPYVDDGSKEKPVPVPALEHYCGTRWNATLRLRTFREPDGVITARIEHRTPDAGLTVVDNMANFALALGAMVGYADRNECAEELCSYAEAEQAYWAAAQHGPTATTNWRGARVELKQLVEEELLPTAEAGLVTLGVEPRAAASLLGIVRQRVDQQLTGAEWLLGMQRSILDSTEIDEMEGIRRTLVALSARQNCESQFGPVCKWRGP
ncbi:MAG: hypothetical protein KDD44_03335 [Bdellovibrionales bacterium]|nr:hypothetical protein [Bdellovibrionales bacterium]